MKEMKNKKIKNKRSNFQILETNFQMIFKTIAFFKN